MQGNWKLSDYLGYAIITNLGYLMVSWLLQWNSKWCNWTDWNLTGKIKLRLPPVVMKCHCKCTLYLGVGFIWSYPRPKTKNKISVYIYVYGLILFSLLRVWLVYCPPLWSLGLWGVCWRGTYSCSCRRTPPLTSWSAHVYSNAGEAALILWM